MISQENVITVGNGEVISSKELANLRAEIHAGFESLDKRLTRIETRQEIIFLTMGIGFALMFTL